MGQPRGKKRKSEEDFDDDYKSYINASNTFGEKEKVNLNFKVNLKFKNVKQKDMFNTILANRITFVSGSAGTGKSLCAMMAGLECLKNPDIHIDTIQLTKPLVETTSQKNGIGALKGDLEQKTSVYFASFYDNLTKLVGEDVSANLKNSGAVRDTVLNYMRGSTFGRYNQKGEPVGVFCILDEAQNTTTKEMLTFLTRLGENTKLIIIGDTDQQDLRTEKFEKNGLVDAIERLQDIDGVGFVEFTEDDIVRDPFLTKIVKRYKNPVIKKVEVTEEITYEEKIVLIQDGTPTNIVIQDTKSWLFDDEINKDQN